jgi:hypothetical protein
MTWIVDNPFVVLALSLVAQLFAAYTGDVLRKTVRPLASDERQDFNTVLTATLTFLALIVGFSFSMAVSRYDLRKDREEGEANAIGTEYVRASLLPVDAGAEARALLKKYLDRRIAFFVSTGQGQANQNAAEAAKLQNELWSTVVGVATKQPTPIVALAVSGMNDVLNAQSYTQAAWWNRIPGPAWFLMGLTAIFSNLLLGYRERKTDPLVLAVLPVIVSVAFFLIADIDSPSGGVIRVTPRNLLAVSQFIQNASN